MSVEKDQGGYEKAKIIIQVVSLFVLGWIGWITSQYTAQQAIYTAEQARIAKVTNQPDFKFNEVTKKIEGIGEIKTKDVINDGQTFINVEFEIMRFYSVIDKNSRVVRIIPVLFKNIDQFDPNSTEGSYIGKGYLTNIYPIQFPSGNEIGSLYGNKGEIVLNTLQDMNLIGNTQYFQSNNFILIRYVDIFGENHSKMYAWIDQNDTLNYDINIDSKLVEDINKIYQSLVDSKKYIYYEDIIGNTLSTKDRAVINNIWGSSLLELKKSKVKIFNSI
jgi:hypothetical protein